MKRERERERRRRRVVLSGGCVCDLKTFRWQKAPPMISPRVNHSTCDCVLRLLLVRMDKQSSTPQRFSRWEKLQVLKQQQHGAQQQWFHGHACFIELVQFRKDKIAVCVGGYSSEPIPICCNIPNEVASKTNSHT